MEQFIKLSAVHAINSEGFVCVSESGNIVLSQSLQSKIYLDDTCISLNDINPKSIQFYHDKNLISYTDFLLTKNAVGVISFEYGFIVLLDDGKLLYIVSFQYIRYVINLSSNISEFIIDYIETSKCELTLFTFISGNILYVIGKRLFRLYSIENVIGYFIINTIIITLNSKNFIEFNEMHKLSQYTGTNALGGILSSRLNNYCKIDYVDGKFIVPDFNNTLKNLSMRNVKSLNLRGHEIFVLLNDSTILCYSDKRPASHYIKMLEISNIQEINAFEDCLVCKTLNALHVIYETGEGAFTKSYDCLDSIKTIYFDGKIILFTDNSIQIIPVSKSSISSKLFDTFAKFIEGNYIFMPTVLQFITIVNVEHSSVKAPILVYLDTENKLTCMYLKDYMHATLSVYISLDADAEYLQLKKLSEGSYI